MAKIEDFAADEPRSITDGPFGSNLKTAHYTEQGPRVIRLQNIGEGRFIDEQAHISEEHYDKLKAHSAEAGDVVVASLGKELPRACTVPSWLGPAIVKADCIRLRPAEDVDGRYVMYMLNAPQSRDAVKDMIHGVGRPRLGLQVIRNIEIPRAPLGEQERIVEAIEEQLSRLGAGVESLRRAKRNLSRLRASILTSAVDGRIVGLEPSEESSSAGLFPIPRGWAWQRTEDVAVVSGGIQKQPKRKPKDNAYPYLRVANVLRGALDLGEVHEMELFGDELARHRLEVGDLLVVEGNGSESQIGRSAMWGGEIRDCVHQNHIIRVRPGQTLEARFLNLYWNSPPAARRVRAVAASTSGLYTLSTSKVRDVPVPVPSLEAQREIVAEVDRQLSVVDAMLGVVENASVRAGTLRWAVLRDAFSGSLGKGSSKSVRATTA